MGIRKRHGRYPAPSQPTFWPLLQEIDGTKLESILLAVQEQLRGPAPKDELIALDGKEPKHGGGQGVLTALGHTRPAIGAGMENLRASSDRDRHLAFCFLLNAEALKPGLFHHVLQ